MAATPKPERMKVKRYRPPSGKNWIGHMIRRGNSMTKKEYARYDRGFTRFMKGHHERWIDEGRLKLIREGNYKEEDYE